MQLKQCHKNWVRKIEIAELEGKKAKAILKKHGIPWDDDQEEIDQEQWFNLINKVCDLNLKFLLSFF